MKVGPLEESQEPFLSALRHVRIHQEVAVYNLEECPLRTQPPGTLFLTFQPAELERNEFLLFQPPRLWYAGTADQTD